MELGPERPAAGGWHPDPTGRFGLRWYDGQRWTDHVVSADGRTITDPLPADAPPYAPPAPFGAPGAPPGFGMPGNGFGPGFGPQMPVRRAPGVVPGAAAILGVVGLVLLALGLFVVDWAKDTTFLDMCKAINKADPTGLHGSQAAAMWYVAGVGYLLLGTLTIFVIVVAVPKRAAGGEVAMRIVCAILCVVAGVLHAITMHEFFKGSVDPGAGAWLGMVGLAVIAVGMLIGNRRRAV